MILIGSGETADAKRRLLERAGAVIVGEEASAALAIVADGDEAAVARLRARGILVNAVDRPELCDFTLPAIVDRAPVLIAIGTGGASAGLAKALRQRVETWLPARLGELAVGLHQARAAIRARWPEPGARRRAIDAALLPGGALDPQRDDAADHVGSWLEATDAGGGDALEHIILTSPDPEELTLRAARLLGLADRVYHAPDVPQAILVRARADAARIPASEPPAEPERGLSLWIALSKGDAGMVVPPSSAG